MQPKTALTVLFVSDLGASRTFFDAAFGWPKSVDEPVYVEYRMTLTTHLGLMPQSNTRQFLGEELGGRGYTDGCPRAELYLQFEDAGPIFERVQLCGARCLSPLAARSWGDRAAYFLIDDGYVLAVADTLRDS